MSVKSFHASYDDGRGGGNDSEKEVIEFWLLIKDMEKNLARSFNRVAVIQDFSVTFTIKGKEAILMGSSEDLKMGRCKIRFNGNYFYIPQDKSKFTSILENYSISKSIDIPEKKEKAHHVFEFEEN